VTDFFDSNGASAQNGTTADYSGQNYSAVVPEEVDGYYVTRFAFSRDSGSATLSNNSVILAGSAGVDQVAVNVQLTAEYGATAVSSGNTWSVALGEGDDGSVVHTLAYAFGSGAFTSVAYDVTSLSGGDGQDNLYATDFISALESAVVSVEHTSRFVDGGNGSDSITVGTELEAGNASFSGGFASFSYNDAYADGGAGDDYLNFYLTGRAAGNGSANITSNNFYGSGGEGNDTLSLTWTTLPNGGTVQFSDNTAHLNGGAGADALDAVLGDGTSGNHIYIVGGDGNDSILTVDFGIGNERVITGGAGDDTVTDSFGFSTVVFDGARSDYTITGLADGWISVVDNRPGSPDGADQLQFVDQLTFSDGSVLVADLALPILGTEGDDELAGFDGDDVIYGLGGNDALYGFGGNDTLYGGAGNDLLIGFDGNDTLFGGDGDDELIGSAGADQFFGGSGADLFVVRIQSEIDVINDFSGALVLTTNSQGRVVRVSGENDKIDLSRIDANVNLDGDQSFTLVQHGFTGVAGQAYSHYDSSTGVTSLFLDVNGDAVADTTIQLLGHVNLTGADFLL
jgi:Ca2+-binding RTX toxin-like protein